jgi:hypothetical protein
MPDRDQSLPTDGEDLRSFDPAGKRHLPVRDVRQEMEEISRRNPTTEEEKQAFFDSKRRLLEDADLNGELKERALAHVQGWRERCATAREDPPVPGGVGAGVWYRADKVHFNTYTALYFYIVTPAAAGGNTNTWLYLTSTNRAAKGVEAFASYYAQEAPNFKVFDWAKPENDHWALTVPYASLGDYLIDLAFDQYALRAFYVVNITRNTGGNSWVNEVLLHNARTGTRDLIYSYAYDLASNDQQHWGGWGPIVETFQQDYGETNVLGFLECLLVQDGYEYTLTDESTFTEDKKNGIQLIYLDPNFNLLAQ